MRFLTRSLVGVFLFAVTLGVLGLAGTAIRSAVETAMSEEAFSRPARERVFAANIVPFAVQTITPVLTSFGEVRSNRTLEIRATASGTVVKLADAFQEGGRVEGGMLLVRVDQMDATSALQATQTDVAEAEAEEREAIAALALAREEVLSAQEQHALRLQALTRVAELFERRIGTEEAVESAALAEASAKQAILSRKQALVQAEARVDLAATNLARRMIALAEAKRRLAETEIFAEFAGTLSGVSVVKGGLVQNNERLAELVDPSALEVSFRVSTAEYARLLDDQGALIAANVDVLLDVFGVDLATTGTITRESAEVGEGLTGRLLFAKIDAAQGFRPGDFVTVQVREPDLPFVAELPATAVSSDGGVLVLGDEDRLVVAQVNVLRRQGDSVLVRSRDLAGKEVVAERTPLLGEGIKIRPLRDTDGTAPEEPAMVELTDERRAKLVAFVEGNTRMPEAAKKRVLSALEKPKVPVQMVERIESRMGG